MPKKGKAEKRKNDCQKNKLNKQKLSNKKGNVFKIIADADKYLPKLMNRHC